MEIILKEGRDRRRNNQKERQREGDATVSFKENEKHTFVELM